MNLERSERLFAWLVVVLTAAVFRLTTTGGSTLMGASRARLELKLLEGTVLDGVLLELCVVDGVLEGWG